LSDSVFGYGAPAFQGTGDPDSTKRTLSNSLSNADWVQSNIISNQSIIDGTRRFILNGSHSEFNVTVLLHKSGTPNADLSMYFTYHGKTVKFFPHLYTDSGMGTPAGAVQDEDSTDALFTLTNVNPITDPTGSGSTEKVILTFQSNEYTNASDSII